MSKRNQGSFVGGLVLGTTIGTITSIFITKNRGKDPGQVLSKTITALQRSSEQLIPEILEFIPFQIKTQSANISKTTSKNWQNTIERVQISILAGIEASKSLQEIKSNSALRDDLEKVIDEDDKETTK